MITAYHEENEDVEFKFIHAFAQIETCEKWRELRTALGKLHSSTRAEQVAKMEEVAAARWALVTEIQDMKLDLIKANVAAKKRKDELAILLIDTSDMNERC
jgi:RPA family protein